ncbi:hypothetical protein EVAR_46049_1 [Eumeta japonica]|uniref:Uncharacterized protein n=1 Tax=Eumeta variegata TaxID=151549 RepID=A0A4C1XFZ2_EUMVA|nr:hypothetical protein EVAR_46049_1 [Eumeta japonica]
MTIIASSCVRTLLSPLAGTSRNSVPRKQIDEIEIPTSVFSNVTTEWQSEVNNDDKTDALYHDAEILRFVTCSRRQSHTFIILFYDRSRQRKASRLGPLFCVDSGTMGTRRRATRETVEGRFVTRQRADVTAQFPKRTSSRVTVTELSPQRKSSCVTDSELRHRCNDNVPEETARRVSGGITREEIESSQFNSKVRLWRPVTEHCSHFRRFEIFITATSRGMDRLPKLCVATPWGVATLSGASHVDATESSEPQGTLGSAVRIVTNIPKLHARKSMTHCRVPPEPSVRARARNERSLFHSIDRCVRVEERQRPHTTYT